MIEIIFRLQDIPVGQVLSQWRSTSKYCISLGDTLLSCKRKNKLTLVARSSGEVESSSETKYKAIDLATY